MYFASRGHDVFVVDNYLRRLIARETSSELLVDNRSLEERVRLFEAASNHKIGCAIGDCTNYRFLERVFQDFQPEAVIHYADTG